MEKSKEECTKSKFANVKFADDEIHRLFSKSNRKKIPLRSYYCKECKSFHITSQALSTKENEIELQIHFDELINKLQEDKNREVLVKENYLVQIKSLENKVKELQSLQEPFQEELHEAQRTANVYRELNYKLSIELANLKQRTIWLQIKNQVKEILFKKIKLKT